MGRRSLLPFAFICCAVSASSAQTTSAPAPPNSVAAAIPLFSMTGGFMDLIYKSGNNAAVVDVASKTSVEQLSDFVWSLIKVIISAYSGFATCIIVGLLFVVLMPLTGLICCCCRSCGKCGGSVPIADPPNAKAKRFTCAAMVFIFTTLILGGSIGVFLSNQAIGAAMNPKDGVLDHAQSRIYNLESAVNQTIEGTLNIPAVRLNAAETRILSTLDGAGPTLLAYVLNKTSAGELLKSTVSVTQDIPALNSTLVAALQSFKDLDVLHAILISRLNAVKTNVTSKCQAMFSNASCNNQSSIVNIPQSDSLAWVQPLSKALSSIFAELPSLNSLSDLPAKVNETKAKVTQEVQNGVANARKMAEDNFAGARGQIEQYSAPIRNSYLEFVNNLPVLNSTDIKKEVELYSDYVRYVGIAIGIFFVFLVFLSYLGLFFGVCGHRPGFEASSCNKGVGAKLLLAVFGLYSLLSWVLMLLTTILFLVSTVKIVCLAIDEPADRIPVSTIRDLKAFGTVTFGDIAEGVIACKNNKSVYEAGLKKIPEVSSALSNLQGLVDTAAIKQAVSGINVSTANISFMPGSAATSLQYLRNVTAHLHNVSLANNTVKLLEQLRASNLSWSAQSLRPMYPEEAAELDNIQLHIVVTIMGILTNLSDSITSLQNRQDIVDKLTILLSNAVATQGSIQNLSAVAHEAIMNVAQDVLSIVDQEIGTLQYQLVNESSCLGVYEQVHAAAGIVCTEMLNPLSGMWFCIGWCLVVFIPNIAFALVLVSLYRREEPYGAAHELADFETQPDNFSVFHHHDNIPLESPARNGAKHY